MSPRSASIYRIRCRHSQTLRYRPWFCEGAYPVDECAKLIERLVDRRLLYDAADPVPEEFLRQSVPENYYRKGSDRSKPSDFQSAADATHRRIDVGTSLGYRGDDPDQFFQHVVQSEQLFRGLLADMADPIDLLYGYLRQLANGKQVLTAQEPDGRKYGPAIVRAHYGDFTYAPHFDSVRLREQRSTYEVFRFEHQFAGVLVLQNSHVDQLAETTHAAQCVVHDCLWTPEIQPYLDNRTFHDLGPATFNGELPGLSFSQATCISSILGVFTRFRESPAINPGSCWRHSLDTVPRTNRSWSGRNQFASRQHRLTVGVVAVLQRDNSRISLRPIRTLCRSSRGHITIRA